MDTHTQREVEVPDGSGPEYQRADHGTGDVEQPREVAVTQRGKQTALAYLGDVQQARAVAKAPPPLGVLWSQLWEAPEVLADNGLMRFLARVYAPVGMLIVSALYWLVAAHLHPVRALLVDTAIGFAIWLWFFS